MRLAALRCPVYLVMIQFRSCSWRQRFLLQPLLDRFLLVTVSVRAYHNANIFAAKYWTGSFIISNVIGHMNSTGASSSLSKSFLKKKNTFKKLISNGDCSYFEPGRTKFDELFWNFCGLRWNIIMKKMGNEGFGGVVTNSSQSQFE